MADRLTVMADRLTAAITPTAIIRHMSTMLVGRQNSIGLAAIPLDDNDCAVADSEFASNQFWHLVRELGRQRDHPTLNGIANIDRWRSRARRRGRLDVFSYQLNLFSREIQYRLICVDFARRSVFINGGLA